MLKLLIVCIISFVGWDIGARGFWIGIANVLLGMSNMDEKHAAGIVGNNTLSTAWNTKYCV